MPDGWVFVSWASEHRAVAEAVVATLERAHLGTWVSWKDIPPGKDHGAVIPPAVRASAAMLLILGRPTFASPHVLTELAIAFSAGIPVLPLLLEPLEDLEPMPAPWEYRLALVQYRSVRDVDEVVDAILDLGRPTAPRDGGRGTPVRRGRLSLGSYRPGHYEAGAVHGGAFLHCWSLDDGRTWSEWADRGFPRPVVDGVLAPGWPGHLECFAVTGDGSVQHSWLTVDLRDDGHDGWTEPRRLDHGLGAVPVRVACTSLEEEHQEVLVVDDQGRLWSRWWWPDGWSEWSPWEVPEPLDDVTGARVATPGGDVGAVLVTGRSGRRWYRTWSGGYGFWTAWTPAGADAALTGAGLLGRGELAHDPSQLVGHLRSGRALWLSDLPGLPGT